MPSFFCYALSMKNLVDTAYRKLKELEDTASPSWDTYSKMADLIIALKHLQRESFDEDNDLVLLIDDMRQEFGDTKTLDILEKTLTEFRDDMDCIAPQLNVCLINKIKENLK